MGGGRARCGRARRWAVLGTAAAASCTAAGLTVEVPVRPQTVGGLFVARIEVGTPPQRLWMQVDSASEWMYVPEARGDTGTGFSSENSTSAKMGKAKSFAFTDGFSVQGVLLNDTVRFGESKALSVPLLLARNITGRVKPPEGVGLLGLVCSYGDETPRRYIRARAWNPFAPDERPPVEERGSVFQHFWEQHPEVPKTYRLELGGPRPRLLLGAESHEGPRKEGGVRYLSTIFTARSSRWYASVRAIGLSQGKDSPSLRWNLDFNKHAPYGAPALFDSGSAALRVGSVVYSRLLSAMPNGCQRAKTGGTRCPCTAASIQDEFPTISISFEALRTFRVLGLDSGDDTIVCIPPHAYVSYDRDSHCHVAIVDGGPRHIMFGYEAVVLGVPFFRSAAVVLDVERRALALGPALSAGPGAAASPSEASSQGPHEWSPDVASVAQPLTAQEICSCADPKNWWSTGKRFSPRRVMVVLVGAAAVGAYIFISHSPSRTAERLRTLANNLAGGPEAGSSGLGGAPGAGAVAAGRRQGAVQDRPFVQMSGRGGPE